MKLNLGCGPRKEKGYVNCDFDPDVNPDKVVDFNKPLPFKDNEFDEVLMRHSLEHARDIGATLSECLRVGKKATILVPAPASPQYLADEHNFLFRMHGLRGGHHQWIPGFVQKILGRIAPTEYVIEITRAKQ